MALIQYARHPSDLVHNEGCAFYPAPEHGVLRRGQPTVPSEKMQMTVGKMWHNTSTGNIVLFGLVT